MFVGGSMRKNIFLCYIFLSLIFLISTLIEIFNYFVFEANTFGLMYLIINLFILLLLILTIFNYRRQVFIYRIFTLFVIIVLGLISSYYLNDIITILFDYTDNSKLFEQKIYICFKIIKPIIYILLLIITCIEIVIKNDLFNKIKNISNKKIK